MKKLYNLHFLIMHQSMKTRQAAHTEKEDKHLCKHFALQVTSEIID